MATRRYTAGPRAFRVEQNSQSYSAARSWLRGLLNARRCLLILLLPFMTVAALAADVTYIYDENNRLTGVVDASGNAAVYSYDASGNIVAISRITAGQVSVIGFAPVSGTTGTTVVISGTGFSSTPSQNSVSFNGTAATVTSATTSQITVTVPSGATTGTISVTSPSGSATSSASFTVTTSHVPTISGFSPSSGVAGASVTISGTNFETTAANNRVGFANVDASVSSSTATSIATTVPVGATSGPISVTTPDGTAFSSSDFFVPPASFAASDIGFTGRLALGASLSVTLSTANKIALVIFDATFGKRVALRISSASFTNSVICKILNPDGSLLASISCGTGAFIEPKAVPTSGTYTILVDPNSTGTGSATLSLYDVPADLSGTIAAGGTAATLSTTTAGQNGSLTFSGTAGQRISLYVSSVTLTGYSYGNLYIKNPDGSNLTSSSVSNGSTTFIDTKTLGSTGTYTILFDPSDIATGSATFTLYDVPADASGSITAGGSAATLTTTVRGQNGSLTFSGTAGQRISLYVSSVSLTGYSYGNLYIKNPDGSTLASSSVSNGSTTFIDTKTLGSTGTYTILFDPSDIATGNATFTLYDVPADASGTITAGGSAATLTTTVRGQNGSLTFSGTAGQRISLYVSSVSLTGYSYGDVYIRNPNGSNLAYTSVSNGSTSFIDTKTLGSTGTYTILFDPSNIATGSATFTLYDVSTDASGSVTIGGSATTLTIGTPGQSGTVTFSGSASQSATVHLTSNSIGYVTVTLRKPDGTSLTSSGSSSSSFNLSTQTLPVTGTYTIEFDPNSTNTGAISVSVTSP